MIVSAFKKAHVKKRNLWHKDERMVTATQWVNLTENESRDSSQAGQSRCIRTAILYSWLRKKISLVPSPALIDLLSFDVEDGLSLTDVRL